MRLLSLRGPEHPGIYLGDGLTLLPLPALRFQITRASNVEPGGVVHSAAWYATVVDALHACRVYGHRRAVIRRVA